MRDYYVYIMTNKSGTLYVGLTNNLERRVWEHKSGALEGFTKRYAMDRLVYCEAMPYVNDAIAREKQIKGWLRRRKFELIESLNPKWLDLAADWTENSPAAANWSPRGRTLRFAQNDKE